MANDLQVFFTAKARTYARFIKLFRYQQGLRACLAGSTLLRSGLRVLDAGCGTGALTLAFCEAMRTQGLVIGDLRAFDLTPAMLDVLRESLVAQGISGVELAQADVLAPDSLPATWRDFDLVLSASMLEYVSREQLPLALGGLRKLMARDGRMLLFITKDNWLMRPLIGQLWRSNLYVASQLREAFAAAGFSAIAFRKFPIWHRHLSLWGHIVEARV